MSEDKSRNIIFEERDYEEQDKEDEGLEDTSARPNQHHHGNSHSYTLKTSATSTYTSVSPSKGIYDAEKCRAHIANQVKVSKIDRFAAQISKAIEVELQLQSRLTNVLNMFVKRSAQVTQEFTNKCKMGLQRHRQDRILNLNKVTKSSLIIKKTQHHHHHHHKPRSCSAGLNKYSISNDLLYGPGAQLVFSLMSYQTMPSVTKIRRKKKPPPKGYDVVIKEEPIDTMKTSMLKNFSEEDYINLADSFEPSKFVKQLGDCLRNNVQKSAAITTYLSKMRQTFERLAADHHDKVDLVYAAEEERQAATVIRRSAYNLSVAAIKATSTPVHVNNANNND